MTVKYDPETMKFVDSTRKTKRSREELFDEVTNLSKRLATLEQLPCYAGYDGQRYYITSNGVVADHAYTSGRFIKHQWSANDSGILPVDVLKKMIVSGTSRLETLESKVNTAYETSPEDTLEFTLESKDKAQVIRDLFRKRNGELSAIVSSIQLPKQVARLYLSFMIVIAGDNPKRFDITLDSNRGSQLRIYISQSTFRDILAFVNNFDEVKRQFKDMVSKILKGGEE